MPSVRLAKGTEIERCREIEAESASVFRESPYPHIADAGPNDIAFFRAAYVDKLLWVALDDENEVVGQLAAAEGPKGLLIAEVDVLPSAQGQGHGRALIAAAESEAKRRRLPFAWLRTFRDVPWNAPFYAKLGYIETNERLWGLEDDEVHANERRDGLDPATRVTMMKPL